MIDISEKHTASLVLGSGGARGLAHIGIIEWLLENNFDIRAISGSSIGALIGGIYAAGKLDIYKNWALALERRHVISLLDLSFGKAGLFKGERIINTLRELIGECNIEDLPISFTAVAADIETEKEVWFSKGPLFDAIRASIATPTLFTPFESNGRTILDGGLVNPVPIAPTLRDQTDITIAVNLSGKEKFSLDNPVVAEEDQPDKTTYRHSISHFIEGLYKKKEKSETEVMGLVNIVTKSIETMQNTIARFKLASYTPDIIIEIPKNACGFFEFDRAEEMIALGRKNACDTISPFCSNRGQ
ncbi:MAG: patatin-like phospholipase family protein [Desulfurivibrionaceae bacterium]